jgi:pimeloyl-ACP methyl ester carboxylesterase
LEDKGDTMNISKMILVSLAILAIASLALTHAQNNKTYVLVHGAWSGKYVWNASKTMLERRGETVITLDLPSHGDDQTPLEQATLEGYKQAVINAIGERSNVILVGHSFGGMVISAVGEAVPEKISKLVYVAAYLPRNGESLFGLSQEDKNSKVGMYWNQTSQTAASIKAEGIVEVFCADCRTVTQRTLVRKHRPEALAPLGTPVTLTAERFGKIPRYYIETLQDNAVSNQLQKRMLSRTSVVASVELNTSHSPFLSQTKAFVDALSGF